MRSVISFVYSVLHYKISISLFLVTFLLLNFIASILQLRNITYCSHNVTLYTNNIVSLFSHCSGSDYISRSSRVS